MSVTGSGMPNLALVVNVVGFSSANVPLSSILSQGVSGCVLHATPDLLEVEVSSSGTASYQIPIPRLASLVGLGLWVQMIPLEVDAQLNILSATATNVLLGTVGSF
jgi:hypothetical protein